MAVNLPVPGEEPWDEKLNAAITEIDSDLQSAKATLGSQVASVDADLQAAKGQTTAVNADLQATKGEVASVDADLQTTKGEVATVDSDLQSAKATFGSQVSTVDADLQTTKGQVSTVDADLQATKTSLDSRLDVLEAVPGDGGGEETPVVGGSSRFVPVIIFNGESNSGGYAQNTFATAHELGPRPEIQIFDNVSNAKFETLNIPVNSLLGHSGMSAYNGQCHGWELGLANSVEAGEWWDNTVYLIKTGQGGSSISQWGAASAYYTTFLTRVRNGLALLRNQGLVPVIYVWYTLGINDAIAGTNEATWLTNVKELHDRMRDELGYVPIFYSKIMTVSAGNNYNDSIDAYCASDNMVIPIDVTGAAVRTDNNHWEYSGMKLIASRFCTASKQFGQHENYMMRQVAMHAGGNVLVPPSDAPAIVRTPATVSFAEGSAGATFTVKLDRVPPANVVITVSVAEGNVISDKPSLTFTTANWSTTQTVTLTSPNDGTNAGNRSSTVTLSSVGVSSSATVGVTVTDAFVAAGPNNTALPVISGGTTVGSGLTCSTGTWTGSPTGYTYQWKRDSLPISGQTTNAHTVVAADTGHTLFCEVSATNALGTNTATTAGLTVPPDLGALVPFTWQNLTNTAPVGNAITVSVGTTPCGANSVQTVDVSQPFALITDWESSALTTGFVTYLDNDQSTDFNWGPQQYTTGFYHVSGNTYSGISGGATLPWSWVATVFPMKIKMEKSGNDVIYSSSENAGATWTPRYTHVGCLAGKTTQYVRVLAAAAAVGQKLTVYNDTSLQAPTAPVNSALPTITGSTSLAGVLVASTGSWSGSPTAYTYQWKRNGTNIAGETTNSHTVVAADQSNNVTVTVTATNAQGSASATSAATAVPAAPTTMVPFSWQDMIGGTEDAGHAFVCNTGTAPVGANAVGSIDVSQPFRIIIDWVSETLTSGFVTMLDDTLDTNFVWSGAQVFTSCVYHSASNVNSGTSGSGALTWAYLPASFPAKIKMEKSGNDVLYYASTDAGSNWTLRYTHVGVLAGKTTQYVRVLGAIPGVGRKLTVSYDSALSPQVSSPVNTALPAITGSTALDGVLTCSTGTWNGYPTPTYAYQWKRDGVAISGETAATHTVAAADQSTTLTVTVTATNATGNASATTAGTAVPAPSSMVGFTYGSLQNSTDGGGGLWTVGSAGGNTGAIANETIDVSQPFRIECDWLNGTVTNAVPFVLDTENDAVYNWVGGNLAFTTSAYCNTSANQSYMSMSNQTNTPWPWVPVFPCKIRAEKSGNDVIYSSSTDGGSTWTPRFTHVGPLAGKTIQYLKVIAALPAAGQKLTVKYDTAMVAGPANTGLPAVTGTTGLGDTLTASQGTWSQAITGYAYQWKRGGVNIAGETGSTHVIVAADQGTTLTVTVTASNANGSATGTSAGTAVPAAVGPPVNTALPVITGSTALAGVLTCSTGTWAANPAPSYAYQWKRGGTDIAGETAAAHTVVAADQTTTLTCAVTATNTQGNATATSAGTAVPAGGAGPIGTPVTWGNFLLTNSPSAGEVKTTSAGLPAEAKAAEAITDITAPWAVEIDWASSGETAAVVVMVDGDANTAASDYTWNAGNNFIVGVYNYSSKINTGKDGGNAIDTTVAPGTFPVKVKLEKSGNDVLIYRAAVGSGYGAPIWTCTDYLLGKTGPGYIKMLNAVGGANKGMVVRIAQ